jgi:origin recognition complex subunit 1
MTKRRRRVVASEDPDGGGAESDGEYRGRSDGESSGILRPDDDDDDPMCTPSKKRKRATPTTPRRKRVAVLAAPTPHSKRAIRARARRPVVLTPPPPEMAGAFALGEAPTETDPWLRAMHALHVGARPEALPCHTEEYARDMRSVEVLLEEGSGGCICALLFSRGVAHSSSLAQTSQAYRERVKRPPCMWW